MTTVANQPVAGDTISGSVKGGVKSHIGDTAGFLGSAQPVRGTVGGQAAGTLGGAVGPGMGFPKNTAGVLTSIEKPLASGS